MSKKFGKILGFAAVAAAVGAAAAAFITRDKHSRNRLEDDFEDFTDEFEDDDECASCLNAERTYTTLPKDGVKKSEEEASDDEAEDETEEETADTEDASAEDTEDDEEEK